MTTPIPSPSTLESVVVMGGIILTVLFFIGHAIAERGRTDRRIRRIKAIMDGTQASADLARADRAFAAMLDRNEAERRNPTPLSQRVW